MKTRQELQDEAIRTLLENRNLIVAWGTGVGKSRVAVRSAEHIREAGGERILLLVAETAHKANWKNEFLDALGLERARFVCSHVTVECYASLEKYEGTSWDLIIADEAHHLRSDLRTGLLSTLKADYFLALTATLSEKGDGDGLIRTLNATFGLFRTLDFNVQAAIDNGILAEPKIYVHILPLEEISAPQHVVITWGPFKSRREFSCSYEEFVTFIENDRANNTAVKATVSCTAKQGYDLLTKYLNAAKKDYDDASHKYAKAEASGDQAGINKYKWKVQSAKNEWLQYGTRRKALIGESKTAFSSWLLSKMEGKKYVCFCSSIEQGVELGGENIIYAERKDNAAVLDDFNNGSRRSIFAVGMIQEGQNLKGIEAGVIIQLSGKERVFVQKFGRALRSKNPEQHIVVMNDTQDVTYYKTAISGINNDYIHMLRYGKGARTA